MIKGDKIYLVTRRDLTISQQAVQCCHALAQFYHENPIITSFWLKESNYLSLLTVENEQELYKLLASAEFNNIACSIFRENDMNDEITAIALEPCDVSVKLCKNLKLL